VKQTNLKSIFRLNEILSLSFSRVLLIAMMTCVGITAVQVAQAFSPSWNGGFLPLICLLISAEVILMQSRLRKTHDLEHSVLFYRVIEIIVILVALKVILSFQAGWGEVLADLPDWPENFINSFLSSEYILSALIVLGVWGLTLWFALDLDEIENDVALVDASDMGGYYSNRSAIRKQMSNRFLMIGFVMIFLTAMFKIDFSALVSGNLIFHHRSGAANILFYFLFGMLLLSQSHFSVLRAGWAWERIPIDVRMARRWIAYSIVALVLVTGLAFLLPTSYSMGLLSTLQYIFMLLYSLLAGLFILILSPLLMLISYLIRLLGRNSPVEELPQMALPTPPVEMAHSARPPWMDVLQSVLFWAIFIGVIGFAFYQYFRQNKDLVQKLKQLRGFKFLAQAWNWIRGRLGNFNQMVSAAVNSGVQKLRSLISRPASGEAWGFVNLRRLTPRQQVLFFYLALVRRGGEAGIERKPSQTPFEYARSLDRTLPEASDSVDSMTDSFMEARYSLHVVDRERASLVKTWWEHVRQALRNLKKPR
jgi:hypothetical protein